MSTRLISRLRQFAASGPFTSALLVVVATFLCAEPASAQLFQWTPQQLIKYTPKNPYERFQDGRPKVPDDLLVRLKGLIAEEVQAALPSRDLDRSHRGNGHAGVLQKLVPDPRDARDGDGHQHPGANRQRAGRAG